MPVSEAGPHALRLPIPGRGEKRTPERPLPVARDRIASQGSLASVERGRRHRVLGALAAIITEARSLSKSAAFESGRVRETHQPYVSKRWCVPRTLQAGPRALDRGVASLLLP